MKLSRIVVFLILSTFSLYSCEKDDEGDADTNQQTEAVSGSKLLISKDWKSVKIFNSRVDVTSQVSGITCDFKSTDSYTSTSSSGSSNGSWSLNGNTLTIDGNNWNVLELNSSSLKIEDNNEIKIYFQ